jgi:UDP-3-O-acyl-N-acetylglucosamine deacetylase
LAHVRAYKPGHDLNTTFAAKLIEEAAATTVPAPTPGEVGCRVQA